MFFGKKRKRDDDPEDERLKLPTPEFMPQVVKRPAKRARRQQDEGREGSVRTERGPQETYEISSTSSEEEGE